MREPTAHHLVRAELHKHCGINLPMDQCTDGCASAATLLVTELERHGHLGTAMTANKALALDEIVALVADKERDGPHRIYPHQAVDRVAGLVGQVAGFDARIEGAQRTLAEQLTDQVRQAWMAARSARGLTPDAGLPPLKMATMLSELQAFAVTPPVASAQPVAAEPASAAEPVGDDVAAAFALLSVAVDVIGPAEPRSMDIAERWDEQARLSRLVAQQALARLRSACGG